MGFRILRERIAPSTDLTTRKRLQLSGFKQQRMVEMGQGRGTLIAGMAALRISVGVVHARLPSRLLVRSMTINDAASGRDRWPRWAVYDPLDH